jgi:hypothetical protein
MVPGDSLSGGHFLTSIVTTIMALSRPATKPAATTKRSAKTAPAVQPRKLSLGTAFETSNDSFFAGPISPAEGEYSNESQFLALLGEPQEGYRWRVKAFAKQGAKLRLEIIAQEEPLQE